MSQTNSVYIRSSTTQFFLCETEENQYLPQAFLYDFYTFMNTL